MIMAFNRNTAISNLMQELKVKPRWAATVKDSEWDLLISTSISQRGVVYGITHPYDELCAIADRYFCSRNL